MNQRWCSAHAAHSVNVHSNSVAYQQRIVGDTKIAKMIVWIFLPFLTWMWLSHATSEMFETCLCKSRAVTSAMTRYILHNWKDTWTPQPLSQLGLRGDPLTLPRNLYHRPFQETECHQRTWGKFMCSYVWISDTERERESEQTSGKALRVGMHRFRPVSLSQCRHVNSGLEIRQHYSPFSLSECGLADTSQSPSVCLCDTWWAHTEDWFDLM